jgi:hypothetical protein
MMLELASLPRDDGQPSESVLKRQKFALFEKQCSKVNSGLEVCGGSMHVSSFLLCAVHSPKAHVWASCVAHSPMTIPRVVS